MLLCCSGLAVASVWEAPCDNFLNEGLYLDDKKHATWTSYNTYTDESCDDWSEGDVINAKKEGWWVESNVDPRLVDDFKATASRTQGNCINGKQEGKVTWWYENGQKALEGNYKNGKLEGKQTYWYDNGQLWYEGNYINGKLEGKWTGWHENGQLWYEGNYINGKLEGKWTEWYENGQKSIEANFIYGKADGKWTKWYEDGTIEKVENYENGELVD